MQVTWGVVARETGTDVSMQFEFQPEHDPPIIGWFINNIMMRPAFMRLGNKLMDNWETAMLDRKHNQLKLWRNSKTATMDG
jgi:hypothetical protein